MSFHRSRFLFLRLTFNGSWDGGAELMTASRAAGIGSITFVLQAAEGAARGNVIMVAEDRSTPAVADQQRRGDPVIAQPLKIQLVVIAGDQVRGVLEPYEDPLSHAMLSTTFTGQLSGDRINGDYVTWGANNVPQRGTWSVRRTRV